MNARYISTDAVLFALVFKVKKRHQVPLPTQACLRNRHPRECRFGVKVSPARSSSDKFCDWFTKVILVYFESDEMAQPMLFPQALNLLFVEARLIAV